MMWEIERFEFPFTGAKNILTVYWKTFVENSVAPYVFLGRRIKAILDNARLTDVEISDVEESWEEIEKGQAKKFTNVDEFLEDLKS